MADLKSWALLAGRILLAAIFVFSGFRKIAEINGTAASIAARGLPYPMILAYCAMVLELVGGGLLVLGLWARWLALAFFVYILVLAGLFHNYWPMEASQQRAQINNFFQHLGIAGGMLYLWACGPGKFSLSQR